MAKKKLEMLVIDDDKENLEGARKFFEGLRDIKVDYTDSYRKAFEMMEGKKYDGILTDKNMKTKVKGFFEIYEINPLAGFEVAIRAERKGIPWVVISEHGYLIFYYPTKKLNKNEIRKVYDEITKLDTMKNEKDLQEVGYIIRKKFFNDALQKCSLKEGEIVRECINLDLGKEYKGKTKAHPRAWEEGFSRLKKVMEIYKR